MLCSFDKLFASLRNIDGFVSDGFIPACPKANNAICAREAGKCAIGNGRQCEQSLWFFIANKAYYSVKVFYVYTQNSRMGFIDTNELCIKRMLDRGIITQPDIDTMHLE